MRVVGKWTRTLGIGAAVFLLFAVVVGIAGAQRPDGGQQGPPPGRGAGLRGADGELRGEFVTQLAANLGLPEDTVRDALAKTREDMRPQLQERFQQMRQRFQDRAQDPNFQERLGELRQRLQDRFQNGQGSGSRPFDGSGFPGGMRPFAPGGGRMGPGLLQMSAEILNVAPDDLRQELEGGKTLAQVAQEKGVDPSALRDQLATRLEQQHDQGIRDGIERIMNQPLGRRAQPQQ